MKKLICTLLALCLILSITPSAFADALADNAAKGARQFEGVSDIDLNDMFTLSAYAMYERGLLTEDQILDIIAVATNTERPDGKEVGSSQIKAVEPVEYTFYDGTFFVGPTIRPDKYELKCLADNTQNSDLSSQLDQVYANSNMPENLYNMIKDSGAVNVQSSGMVVTIYNANNSIDTVCKLKLNDTKTITLDEGQYIVVESGTIKLSSIAE